MMIEHLKEFSGPIMDDVLMAETRDAILDEAPNSAFARRLEVIKQSINNIQFAYAAMHYAIEEVGEIDAEAYLRHIHNYRSIYPRLDETDREAIRILAQAITTPIEPDDSIRILRPQTPDFPTIFVKKDEVLRRVSRITPPVFDFLRASFPIVTKPTIIQEESDTRTRIWESPYENVQCVVRARYTNTEAIALRCALDSPELAAIDYPNRHIQVLRLHLKDTPEK